MTSLCQMHLSLGWKSLTTSTGLLIRLLSCSSVLQSHLSHRRGLFYSHHSLRSTTQTSKNDGSLLSSVSQQPCRQQQAARFIFHLQTSKHLSLTTQKDYCHKTYTELQKQQLLLTMEEEEREQHYHTVHGDKDRIMEVITQNIRLPGEGEEDIVTPRLKEILRGIHRGDRARLAEAITLVESKHPRKHKQAQWLLTKMLSHRSKLRQLGRLRPTIRIGLTGPPGAGKSTLAETFGQLLTGRGFKLAVLAVDPSSWRTGGSIMGDKTRMVKLSRDPNAYIRPSPSSGNLGGVTRSTGEVMLLCEGAGYDIILVETVGVGQSETAVCDMVDMFVLVIPPAAGDELQGLKRGIVELSDLVVINKADGDLLPAARRIKADYTSAVKLTRSKSRHWTPRVLMVSALENKGIEKLWDTIQEYCEKQKAADEFEERRKRQRRLWLWNHIDMELRHRFRTQPGMTRHVDAMESRVMAGSMAPGTAADVLLDKFFNRIYNNNNNH